MGIFRKREGHTHKSPITRFIKLTMKASEDGQTPPGVIVESEPKEGGGYTKTIIEPENFRFMVFDEAALITGDGDTNSSYFRFSEPKKPVRFTPDKGDAVKLSYSELKALPSYKASNARPVLIVWGLDLNTMTPAQLTLSGLQMSGYFDMKLDEKNALATITGFERKEITVNGKKVSLMFPIWQKQQLDAFAVIAGLGETEKDLLLKLDYFITERLGEEPREKLLFPETKEAEREFNDLPFGDEIEDAELVDIL